MPKTVDLTPKMNLATLESELFFPESTDQQVGSMIGGLTAGSRELTHGKITIAGVDEQIRLGDATAYDTGVGVFMGKDPDDGLYKFRAGDPAGTYLSWDGSTLGIIGFLEDGEAANDVNTNATTINGGKITANSITSAQITTGEFITLTAQIKDAIITSAKIVSLDATKITSQIVNAQIASIEWAKIDNVSVGTADIENAAVTNAKIDSLSADKLTAGTIDAGTITVENLNATNITSGNYSVGGTGNPSYMTIKRDNTSGSNAYLRWEGGSKMWSDTNNDIGVNAIGGEMYFYMNSAQIFYLDNNAQAVIGQDNATYDVGLYVWGNLNSGRGDVRFKDAQVRINTSSSPSEQLYVEGSAKFVGNTEANHMDPRSSASYNLGGSSQYWNYLNVYDISKQGGGGFGVYDDGVKMQDGRVLPDTEALLAMKPHKTKKTDYGKPIYDMETIPADVRIIPKEDNYGNKIVKQKDGRYIAKQKKDVWDEKKGDYVSKVVEVEHTEGERVFAMMSIMMGAIRELTLRVKELENG